MKTTSNAILRLLDMIIESNNAPVILETNNSFYFNSNIPNEYHFPNISEINSRIKIETMIDSLLSTAYSKLSDIEHPLQVFFEQWDNQQLFMNSINLNNDFILQARLITFQIKDKKPFITKSNIGIVIGALNQKSNTFIDLMFIKLYPLNDKLSRQIIIYTNQNIIYDFDYKVKLNNQNSINHYILKSYNGLSIEDFQYIAKNRLQQAESQTKVPNCLLSLQDIKSKMGEMAENNPIDLVTFLLISNTFVHFNNKSLIDYFEYFNKYKKQANLIINEFNVLSMPTIDIIDINNIKYNKRDRVFYIKVSLNFGKIDYDNLLEVLFIKNHDLLLELKKREYFNTNIKQLFESLFGKKEFIINSTLLMSEVSSSSNQVFVRQSLNNDIIGNILKPNNAFQIRRLMQDSKKYNRHMAAIYNAIFDILFNQMVLDNQFNDIEYMSDDFNKLVDELPDWLDESYLKLTNSSIPCRIYFSNGKCSKSLLELQLNGFDDLLDIDLSKFLISCEKGKIQLTIKDEVEAKNIKQLDNFLKAIEILEI